MTEFDSWPTPPWWLTAILQDQDSSHLDRIGQVFNLVGHSAKDVRQWIVNVCKALEVTPTFLAAEAGLSASTINRFLRQTNDANLTARSIAKIAFSAGQIHLKRAQKTEAFISNEQMAVNAIKFCPYPREYFLRKALFSGVIQNCTSVNENDWSLSAESLIVPSSEKYPSTLRAMIVKGREGLPCYFDGQVLICEMLHKSTSFIRFLDSQVVAFEMKDGSIRCGLWRYVVDPAARVWLMPLNEESEAPGIFLGSDPRSRPDIYISHMVIAAISSA